MSKIDTFICNDTKSPRCHHLRFFRLTVGEKLDINMVPFKKVGAFSARNSFTGALRRVMPWDKVRSRRPVKISLTPFPPNMGQTIHRIGCQGDDAHDAAIMAVQSLKAIGLDPALPVVERGPAYRGIVFSQERTAGGGDRTPESIGGNEKTPSA